MSKLPGDSGVPPSARSSHPSAQSSASGDPALDPDPHEELDGEVVELVLRELDDVPDDVDPESAGASVYSFGAVSEDRDTEIYDYEGDGPGTAARPPADAPSTAGPLTDPEADGDTLEDWIEPDEDWFNDGPGNGSSGSIASIDSAGSIAATRSVGSIASTMSAGSIASALSAGSIASALSAGSVGSLISLGSLGSIFSVGSYRSILSIGSRNSILSIGAEDGFLTIGRGANAKSFGGR